MSPSSESLPSAMILPHGLRLARWWLVVSFWGCFLVVCVLSIHLALQANPREQAAIQWMHALDLCMPAFWPSGTGPRAPQSLVTGVIPRMTPGDMDLEMHGTVMRVRLQEATGQVVP